MSKEKVLQIVILAPNDSIIERLIEMHPMRQVAWATIVQILVLGFMGVAMTTIHYFIS